MDIVIEETSSGRSTPSHSLVDLPASLLDLISASSPTSTTGSPAAQTYLQHIASLALPELMKEPERLATDAAASTDALTALCQREYRTFLSVSQTTSTLSTSLDSLNSSLTHLLTALPTLDAQCRAFASQTATLQSARARAALVLEQADKLLDILELPPLLDACVRAGHYQEALDLAAHAAALAARFPAIPAAQDVAAEAAVILRQMLVQLLSVLREPAKLPALFKAVNFLRRMHPPPLSEPELALAFLTSRTALLAATLPSTADAQSEPARFVRRFVDAFREGAYDVLTQYATIFLDRPSAAKHPELRDYLPAFSHHLLSLLLDTLSTTLPLVEDASALSSLLTQLSYAASSFARLGLDFRPLLAPLFERAVLATTARSLSAAHLSLSSLLSSASRLGRPPSFLLMSTDAPPSLLSTSTPSHAPSLQNPPAYLASLPPLATYLNAQLTALNALRLLAPASLLPPLLAALDTSLVTTSRSLLQYVRISWSGLARRSIDEERTSEREKEKRVLILTGRAWVDDLAPFLRAGLVRGVYGRESWEGLEGKDWEEAETEWEAWLSEVGEERTKPVNGVAEVDGPVEVATSPVVEIEVPAPVEESAVLEAEPGTE